VRSGKIQTALGLLCRRDGDAFEFLEPQTGAAVRKLPAAPTRGYLRRFSAAYAVSWGVLETRSGNNCSNPFSTEVRRPDEPFCTPSHGMTFTRAGEGGSVYRFGPSTSP
jgi:hypothetical protein